MALTVVDGYMINTVLIDMEIGIYEQISQNSDGSYTIFLNSRYNDTVLREAYLHAIGHIKRHDWEKTDVQEVEAIAHGAPDPAPEKSSLIAELIKRHQKNRAARKRKLDMIAQKYASMSLAEIDEHNQAVIARRDYYETQ